MKLEIPLKEIQDFIRDHFQSDVGLMYIEKDKIQAKYYVTIDLIIKEVRINEVYLSYEVSGLAGLISNLASGILKKKLEKIPIEWYPKTREIHIDLKKIHELNEILKFIYISDIQFLNDNILLVLHPRKNDLEVEP